MLSIGKLAAGPTAVRYYEQAVASGREDYYAGEGEAAGRWVGSGSAKLGLSGEVKEGQAGRLLAGEHPATEQLLGAAMGEGSIAGFDLTFNTPKSVSVVYGIGDHWTARVLRECHERAVDDATAKAPRKLSVLSLSFESRGTAGRRLPASSVCPNSHGRAVCF